MGHSGKLQHDMGLDESNSKKWVIAGIQLKAPVKPIYANPIEKERGEFDYEDHPSTPTGEEHRIPANWKCPPAPMKRKPSLKCNYDSNKQLFKDPDLENVFCCHVKRKGSY